MTPIKERERKYLLAQFQGRFLVMAGTASECIFSPHCKQRQL